MEPIYNRNGSMVAWLRDDVIYDISLKPCAFIRNETVFTYLPHHIGRFDCGFFRDKSGRVVAFISGATGGAIPPAPKIPPSPPVPSAPTAPPAPSAPPAPPASSSKWSSLDWEEFLLE